MIQGFDIFIWCWRNMYSIDTTELEENLLMPENPLISDEHTGVSGMNHISEYLVDVASMISQS